MATSLSEQLQRLAVPQTSSLVESKSTASILYDRKRAAEIDRQTIFDLSKSGLEELILSNSVFRQFQNTLFDDSTINFERSVETGHVNETLDKNIRKFLFHLSPYFLIQSAHKCLEWLIRRHRIHEYNVDDMVALILPYHETMIFVKCVQTMSLGKRSRWHWMQSIQKPGVSLSKQTIIERAATDPAFLQFISETTLAAVNELNANARAHMLQALFAFYSAVTLGALNAASKISESHFSNISRTLLKGLSSDVIDFRAASMIITAFLMTRLKFKNILLKKIIDKLTNNIYRQELRKDAVLLLIIIFQTQDDVQDVAAVDTFWSKVMDNSTLITSVIGSLYQENINVMPLCLPLITKCLGHVDNKKKAKGYRKFVEALLTELALNDVDANTVIRCILDGLKRTPKPQSEIIDLNSDDDGDVDMENGRAEESNWHSSLMRILETRYSEVFDAMKTKIMSSQDEESCSLKIVLGALLCSTYNADPSGASVFIDLYHPNAQNRMHAVENLVKMNKLSTMPFSDDKKNLLVAGIGERLNDDSPDVVHEVLKFKTEDLVKIVGEQNLIKKLKSIIGGPFMSRKEWQLPISSAIKHITSKHLLSNDNETEIFVAIWPYMFPMNEISFYHAKAIAKSAVAGRFPILKQLQDLRCNVDNRMECVNKWLENAFEKSKINEIVQFVKAIPDVEITKMSAFHIINLLTHALPKNSDQNLSKELFDIATKFEVQFELKSIDIDQYAQELYSRNQPEKLPTQLLIDCIQTIMKKTNFSAVLSSNIIDFTNNTDTLILILKLHGYICNGLFTKSKRASALFNQTMAQFIHFVLPSSDRKLDFFSNFYITHYIDLLSQTPSISPEVQLRSMHLFNEMLAHTDTLYDITMEVFIRIISGLTSPFEAVRLLTCDTIERLYGLLTDSSEYSKFFGLILTEKEKFLIGPEELPMILHGIKYKRAQLFEYIKQPNSAMMLKATLLDMLNIVGDSKHDPEYLKVAVDVALGILNKCDSSQTVVLNPHESIVVYRTILRLNDATLSSIYANAKCLKFFEAVLQQSNVLLQIDNKTQSISVHAMNSTIFDHFTEFTVKQQKSIINLIVESATFSKCNDVRKRARKFFRKSIELNGQIELDILTKMTKVAPIDVSAKKRTEYLSTELLQTSEWRRGVTLLEFLHKKRLTNPLHLIRQLFPVLQKCLKFDDQSPVEYTKQFLLNAILNCCMLMPPTGPFLENDFKIDLVVQCVRGTQNPQTQHHALELLTQLATMIPDAVLHQIMEIFTFVGDAVVRRDDNYIYQLISNVIKSVVPILKENNIVQVLKAFSDIILDVPAHRRPALYEDLLNTLDPRMYLWVFVALVFEQDVRETDDQKKLLRKTVLVVEIANLFDCDTILYTCYQLIVYLQNQLSAVDKHTQISAHFKQIFDVEIYDKKRVLQYINQILKFINVLTLDKSEFSGKMASLDRKTLHQHKKTFRNIIPAILMYIKASTQSSLRHADKAWNDGLSACYHILDHLLDLLYPDMLLQVVEALLGEENEMEVRRKIIDLLNKKLESPEQFANCKESMLSLLDPLSKIVSSIPETPRNSSLPQDALVAIQLLSGIIARDNPDEFGAVLKSLSKILRSYSELSIRLRAYLIQCLGELCANLRVHGLKHLHRFMPAITDVLNDLLAHKIDVTSPAFEMILKAIYRIVQTVPRFLTPYLVNLITSLSILWSRLQSTSSNDSQKNLLKLDEIWRSLASSLELRVLIPMVEKHIYPDLLAQGKFSATGPLMVLLLESFGHSEQADVAQNSHDLMTFFIEVLDFRSNYHRECDTVDVQEDFFIKTLIGFILKLTDKSFRPFFYKLLEWSEETADKSYDRALTFYRLSSKLADRLMSLFITYASPIVPNAAASLKEKYTKAQIKASSAPPAALIYNTLSTLHTVFLYGNHQFISSQRFNVLMEPLVNLLDQEEYLADENITEILPKCFAQLAVEANNDLLWKQLNQQILKKTRSPSVLVRRLALLCSVEVIIRLGEDATQLYQEMIPFFSELLEDDDTGIQQLCSKCITDIEASTGEDLKRHL